MRSEKFWRELPIEQRVLVERHVRCEIDGKVSYSTRTLAKMAAHHEIKMSGHNLEIYYCHYSRAYHLTSQVRKK